jgi:transcription initiation factor TFIIIB Brf1 subunit/transcription initiation factor TFIIB
LFNKNEYLKETRLPICNVCEFKIDLVGDESICGKCGCIIKNKVLVKEEKCLINKW